MNVLKTKWMIIRLKNKDTTEMVNDRIYIGNIAIERVQKYLHLGSWFHEKMVRATVIRMRNLICRHNVSLDLRMKICDGQSSVLTREMKFINEETN